MVYSALRRVSANPRLVTGAKKSSISCARLNAKYATDFYFMNNKSKHQLNVSLALWASSHKVKDVVGFEESEHGNVGLSRLLALWFVGHTNIGHRGWTPREELFLLAKKYMWLTHRTTFDRIVESGEGIFWQYSKKDDRLYFRSEKSICKKFGIEYVWADECIIDIGMLKKQQHWNAAIATANIPSSGVYLSRGKQTKLNGRSRPTNAKYEKIVGIEKSSTLLCVDIDQPQEQVIEFVMRSPEGIISWHECKNCSWTGKGRDKATDHQSQTGHSVILVRPGVNRYLNGKNEIRYRKNGRSWRTKATRLGSDCHSHHTTVYFDSKDQAKRFRKDDVKSSCYMRLDARPKMDDLDTYNRRGVIRLSWVPVSIPHQPTQELFAGFWS